MAENSTIEWTDHTFNPWTGCTKVSPACDHCYAESWAKRSGHVTWGPHGARRRTSPANWRQPIKWNAAAEAAGRRAKVFCASLADVFDNHGSIQPEWRADLWALIGSTPHLDWLLLTKRPQNISRYLPNDSRAPWYRPWNQLWPWPNVWLGTTVENQVEADQRIPHLLSVPAKVRFLSCEPMLGQLALTNMDVARHPAAKGLSPIGAYWVNALTGRNDDMGRPCPDVPRLHWIICGGESGPGARPMHPDWARSLRDQCAAADVPFFFKQWGEWLPDKLIENISRRGTMMLPDGRQMRSMMDPTKPNPEHEIQELLRTMGPWQHLSMVGKKRAGRLLDGVQHDGMPA